MNKCCLCDKHLDNICQKDCQFKVHNSGWIDVNKIEPSELEKVFVCYMYNADGEWHKDIGCGFLLNGEWVAATPYVTHWMKKPNLPSTSVDAKGI